MDSRQKDWFGWPAAAAPGGPCVSCHTGMTYLLARPALRRALGESERNSYETGLLAGMRARMEKKEAVPGSKPVSPQAAGVEAVLSALFLADEPALDRMWSLQIRDGEAKGAWPWFSLKLDPWEMPDSQFYGAALAALATGSAPAEYRGLPEIHERVAALIEYLRREQSSQPLHNRVILLWASTKLPEALPEPMRRSIIEEVWKKQQEDGGWTIASLGPWKEHATAPPSTGSNAYATGLVAFVLEKAVVPRTNAKLTRALDWLRSHQDRQSGYWSADSMNKKYEPGSMQAGFMRDAATAFATLALLGADHI
jgi:squalene-hopene/tetraprenyl-beta-curcumene cyclase